MDTLLLRDRYRKVETRSDVVWLIIFFAFIFTGCRDTNRPGKSNPGVGQIAKISDSALALNFCSTCHLSVHPTLLDSTTWIEHVLPAMATKAGIGVWQGKEYFSVKNNDSGNTISLSDWDRIVNFYRENSPDKVPLRDYPDLISDWGVFSLVRPRGNYRTSSTTSLVAIDTLTHSIYSSDATAMLMEWDQTLKKTSSVILPSPGVDITFQTKENQLRNPLITCIGNMTATNEPLGQLVQPIGGKSNKTVTRVNQLRRPVASATFDYNRDGKSETIVAGFGHDLGALSIVTEQQDGTFLNRILWDIPGALQIENTDFNRDGWMDFVVLFAHADESLWLFENDRKGDFIKKRLLQFSPLNGSSSFQLVDFNNDGKNDILYTCGDNSDYSRVLKPFHGVYIYLNVDSTVFKKQFFYPVDGCTKAIAADFDLDGKLEIASIAFFADLSKHPADKFLYFKATKGLNYKPVEIPISKEGRWICMDAGDVDGDNDIDIVLGNYSKGFLNIDSIGIGWNESQPLIILKNNSDKVRRQL